MELRYGIEKYDAAINTRLTIIIPNIAATKYGVNPAKFFLVVRPTIEKATKNANAPINAGTVASMIPYANETSDKVTPFNAL